MSTRISVDLIRRQQAISRRNAAAKDLYETELALHAARQSQVDEWVRAASEHLHLAVLVLGVAEADVAAATRISASGEDAAQPERELCPVPVRQRRGPDPYLALT